MPLMRLDKFLSELGVASRKELRQIIKSGRVLVNGRPAAKSLKLSGGETVLVSLPEPEPTAAQPQDIPLDVVYEDGDVIVVNKPRGGLHAVLLQQLLVGAPSLGAHALADIRQRNTISPCHIGKAGLTIILGDLLQRRLHQCIAAHGLHAGLLRGAFKLCHHCICPP